jgi:hypothetical protein
LAVHLEVLTESATEHRQDNIVDGAADSGADLTDLLE